MPCAPQWIDSKALLARVPLFAGMKLADLARLASGVREIHAQRGDTLFRKDDACSGLYLVVYGRVKLVFTSPQGSEKILDILDQGSTFCESTMFLGKTYQVYAQTLTDCLLLHISKSVIVDELENGAGLARRIIDSLSQRLFDLTSDVESYSLHSGRQRVINHLLREGRGSDECVRHGENSLTITLLVSKSVIASRLNLTQEHFSRILHELSECGLIVVDGREIFINDVARLRQYAS